MKNMDSIIYVNFSPYENTGKILDYLKENFEYVAQFSFDFHKLEKGTSNILKVFQKGNLKEVHKLRQIHVPKSLVFLLLPVRSFIIFLQILYYCLFLTKKYKKFDVYLTVNAFTAWCGNLVRDLRLVEKTVFWVWDYYPPSHESKIVTFMRRVYWYFDKSAGTKADKTVFLNSRLLSLRRKIGILDKDKTYALVPIGTDPKSKVELRKNFKKVRLGFIGVVKKSQGLDLIFDTQEELVKNFPKLELEIIGAGPDLEHFKRRAKKSRIKTTFQGLLSEESKAEEKEIKRILSNCNIGLATYIPEESNVSFFGDPSKIKRYLSLGLPVITTNVFYFVKEFQRTKAGIVIDYYKPQTFVEALDTIISKYGVYQKNALNLAKKYHYQKIYPDLFDF